MPNDDFSPELIKLDGDYQVLTELHGEGNARAYLARHLRLNRDVTISVFHAADADTTDALSQFASDTRLLAEARHPHVVPVVEGIWLDDTTYASIRARIRGATLDQLLSASGPMSISRVGATVHEIAEAITWARETGISQRDIAPWDVVFQQGTGRVMLSFEPAKTPANAGRTECDDAQTVRRLAIEMLSGEIDRNVAASEIAVPRSIPADVADSLAAIRYCDPHNAGSSLSALLAALDAAGAGSDKKAHIVVAPAPPVALPAVVEVRPHIERVVPTVVQRAADVPAGPLSVITKVPPHRRGSPGGRDDAVILSKPSIGFNARLAFAVVLIAAAGVGGFVFMNRDDAKMTNVAIIAPRDTGTSASGEVALHPQSQPQPQGQAQTTPTTTRRAVAATRGGSDSVAAVERAYQRDSAADAVNPCASADSVKQRHCLTASIAKNDRELNAVYARLVAALSQQSNAGAIDELNAAQEKWSDERDAACREVGEAPMYAKSRGACYAQKATDRARELRRRLDSLPPD